MGAFFRELMHVGLYKRSQGRITRQVTFAALALTIALGILRLSGTLAFLDPVVKALPARVTCTTKTGRLDEDATVKVTGTGGSATVAVHAGETLAEVAEAIDALRSTTGVAASVNENTKALALSSIVNGSGAIVQTAPTSGLWQTEGLDSSGTARGQDELNVGLHFLIPGLVLVVGVWVSYRVVNFPAFADFLIAVEAEMNKVSWPTRTELIRASMVVLILIFALAFILSGYDYLWAVLLRKVLHIF